MVTIRDSAHLVHQMYQCKDLAIRLIASNPIFGGDESDVYTQAHGLILLYWWSLQQHFRGGWEASAMAQVPDIRPEGTDGLTFKLIGASEVGYGICEGADPVGEDV